MQNYLMIRHKNFINLAAILIKHFYKKNIIHWKSDKEQAKCFML